MGASTDPVYLRVLDDLRSQIREGTLPPGARVPSRAAIMTRYGVGETAAKHALAVLATEGLIEPRPGSGSYVRQPPVVRRLDHDRLQIPGSPFGLDEAALPSAADGQSQARRLTWEHYSERVPPPPHIARRLRTQPDDRVMRTKYVLRADGSPVQMATSYEPMEITAGTPVLLPEEGPLAGRGVIARMGAIGLRVDQVIEEISTRPPHSAEAASLAIPTGTPVLHIERTHLAGDRPVETCDIIVPADQYRLRYRIPVPPQP
jgi:GntR family transcriptional regulator